MTQRFAAAAAALLPARPPWAQERAPPPAPPPPPAEPTQQLDRVEVTDTRADETEQRRQSTAAKIVVGREEIERYGDSSTLGEGASAPARRDDARRAGRGAIRMRGLGSGYTQIPARRRARAAGFSIDSMDPDQVERIEILRAPTAETGARAIAGTINIVTREGYRSATTTRKVGAAGNDEVTPGSPGRAAIPPAT